MGISRRAVLKAAAGTGVAGLGMPELTGPRDSPRLVPAGHHGRAGLRPVSMAMHLHGPFSEGKASMAAHLDQARQLGVDVLFWTEHDFRVSAQGYRTRMDFQAASATEFGVTSSWVHQVEGAPDRDTVEYIDGYAQVSSRAAGADFGTVWLFQDAWNTTYRTSIADTTIAVDVTPGPVSADAELVVELLLSYHPAERSRPAGQYRLVYRLGAYPQLGLSADGLTGTVTVPVTADTRGTVTLRPARDVHALWRDQVSGDHSLFQLRVGVTSRNGASASARWHAVTLDRAERAGQASLALYQRLIDEYARRYPDRRQYAALEVSLTRHLNWFGGNLTMPDYTGIAPKKNDAPAYVSQMVRFIQEHSGLACYNHPLYGTKEAVAQELVASRVFGADIIEIGAGPPADADSLLYVYDALARNGVFVTANGVTDDHDGVDWRGRPANWVTKVWAHSVELTDLTGALSAGRAWFHRPDQWGGELDIQAAGRPAMGGVLVGAAAVPVTVHATDVPADGLVEIVTGPVDRLDPSPNTTSRVVQARDIPGDGVTQDLEPGSYVRAQVRAADGMVVGISNPCWVLPTEPSGGVPADRRVC